MVSIFQILIEMPNLRDFPIDQKMPSKNDVLFFIKRRVVFHKTTACFIQCFGVEISLIKKQMEKHKINRENTCSLYLSRVRAHTLQEFFLFCCHKCHSLVCNSMEFSVLSLFWECVLTIAKISTRWRVPKYFKKGDFYLCGQLDLSPIFLPFFLRV